MEKFIQQTMLKYLQYKTGLISFRMMETELVLLTANYYKNEFQSPLPDAPQCPYCLEIIEA